MTQLELPVAAQREDILDMIAGKGQGQLVTVGLDNDNGYKDGNFDGGLGLGFQSLGSGYYVLPYFLL